MLKTLKQARAALGMLNPEEARRSAERPIHFGLVAASQSGYSEMEDFLVPPALPREERIAQLGQVHRAGDIDVPSQVDLVLYQQGLRVPEGAYVFRHNDPDLTVEAILEDQEELALGLARQFPAFRRAVIDDVILTVSRENALFSIATALPNIMPSMMELPWAFGEFASDTAFLTANQIRMAFQIGAACGSEIGFANQKGSLLAIVGGAFGWRALARELAGKIPLGEGLIPKGAIAFAGTYVVGKGLQRLHTGGGYPGEEPESTRRKSIPIDKSLYKEALERGRQVVQSFPKRG